MAKSGSCMFRIGYFLYTRTKVGYFYHRREIAKAKDKFSDGGSHSVTKTYQCGDLQILPIPMMMDNYAYLIMDSDSNTAVVVDPGDPEPVQKVLQERDIIPRAVLVTHKHWDHSGGNSEMKRLYPDIRIYGGVNDGLRDCTNPVSDGDKLEFGRLKFSVMFTPGHTTGHVVYLLNGTIFGGPNALFSGDHLFLAGCGRMFEGSSIKMLKSLDSLQALDDSTLVWPGHEYAEDNLEFAAHIDSENSAVKEKYRWVKEQRKSKLCTSPSSIGEEKTYNPFLRSGEEAVMRALDLIGTIDFSSPSDEIRSKALAELRERKDQFNYKL